MMRTGATSKYEYEDEYDEPDAYDEYESGDEYEDEYLREKRSVENGQQNGTLKDSEDEYRRLALGDEDLVDRVTNLLNGKSTGRRIKRVVFKYGLFQSIVGFILVVIASYENVNFFQLDYFNQSLYGAPVLILMWLVSFPTWIIGLLSLLAVYYWASLCTNRELFTSLLKIYFGILFFLFFLTLWFICALFLTFKGADWKANVDLIAVYPVYIVTCICVLPYLFSLAYYLMDVHYLNDEVMAKGNIAEVPSHTYASHMVMNMKFIHIDAYMYIYTHIHV
jgi:hypothetical protein